VNGNVIKMKIGEGVIMKKGQYAVEVKSRYGAVRSMHSGGRKLGDAGLSRCSGEVTARIKVGFGRTDEGQGFIRGRSLGKEW